MRIAMALFAVTALVGCQTANWEMPTCPPETLSRAAAHLPQQLSVNLVSNIAKWRNQLVPVALGTQQDRLKDDSNAKVLYTEAAASVNEFINALDLQLRSRQLDCGQTAERADEVDRKIKAFVDYVGQQRGTAAIDYVVLAPIVKELVVSLFEQYRKASAEDKKEIERQRNEFLTDLQKHRLETDVTKLK